MPLRLALYVGSDKKSAKRFSNSFPPGSASKVHFLESLKLHTALIFHRYFQDAGELLWAIQHKADIARALSWGKSIETGLAESVKSKLDAILLDPEKTSNGDRLRPEYTSAESLRTNHGPVVLHTVYARLLILYLLNNLYDLLGIRSEKEKYFERLNSFVSDSKKWFSPEVIELATDNSEALHDLMAIHSAFETSIRSESPDELPKASSEIDWIKQISGFARFLAILRKRGTQDEAEADHALDPRFAKVFFSSIHLVPSGVEVFNKVRTTMRDGNGKVLFLSVQEPPDAGFKELILARLWLSDAVLAILPRKEKFDGSPGSYHWIGKESALALLTDRHVSFAMEAGVDRDQVKPDFKNIDDDLFPWAERTEAIERLEKHFDQTVAGDYAVTDPKRPLDDRLKGQLERLVAKAIKDRTEKLVKGFLEQFPPDVLLNLKILQHARTGQQSSWMVHLLREAQRVTFAPEDNETKKKEKARAKFQHLYQACCERAMILSGSTYSLMSVRDNKRRQYKVYFWQLPAILRELRPTSTPEELTRWEDAIVEWATARGEEIQRKLRAAVA